MNELESFLAQEDRERRPSILKQKIPDQHLLDFLKLDADERFVGRWRGRQIRYHLDDRNGMLHGLGISPLPRPMPATGRLQLDRDGTTLEVGGDTFRLPGLARSGWSPRNSEFSHLTSRSQREFEESERRNGSPGFDATAVGRTCASRCSELEAEIDRLRREIRALESQISDVEDQLGEARAYLDQLNQAVRDARNRQEHANREQNKADSNYRQNGSEINRLENRINDLGNRIDNLQNRYYQADTSQEQASIQREADRYKRDINECEQSIRQCQRYMEEAQSYHDQMVQVERQAERDEQEARSYIPDAQERIRQLERERAALISQRNARQQEMEHAQWLLEHYREVQQIAPRVSSLLEQAIPYRPAINASSHVASYCRAVSSFYACFDDVDIDQADDALGQALQALTAATELCRHYISTGKQFLDVAVAHLLAFEKVHLTYAFQPLGDLYEWLARVADRYADGRFLGALETLGETGIPSTAGSISSGGLASTLSSWSSQVGVPDRERIFTWSRSADSLLSLISSVTSFAYFFDADMERISAEIQELFARQRDTVHLMADSQLADDSRWETHLEKIRRRLYARSDRVGLEETDAAYLVWYLGPDKFDRLLRALRQTVDTLNKALATIADDNLQAYRILCVESGSAENLFRNTVSLDEDFRESGNQVYNRLVVAADRAQEVRQHRLYILSLLDRYVKDPDAATFMGFNLADRHHQASATFSQVVRPETDELEEHEVEKRKGQLNEVDRELAVVANPFGFDLMQLPEQTYDVSTNTNIQTWGKAEVLFVWSEELQVLQLTYEYLWAHDRLAEQLGAHQRQAEICAKLDILEARYKNYRGHQQNLEEKLPERWNHWLEFREQLNTSIRNGIELLSGEEMVRDCLQYGHDIAEWIVQCYRVALDKYEQALGHHKARLLLEGKVGKAAEDGALTVRPTSSNSAEADELTIQARQILDKVKFKEASKEKISLPIVPGDRRSEITLDRDLGYSLVEVVRQRKQMARDAEGRIRSLVSLIDRFGESTGKIPVVDFLRVMAYEEGFRRRMQLFSVPIDLTSADPEQIPKTPQVFSLSADEMWKRIIEAMNARDKVLPSFSPLLLLDRFEGERPELSEGTEATRKDGNDPEGIGDPETGLVRADVIWEGQDFIRASHDLVVPPTEEIFQPDYHAPLDQRFCTSLEGLERFLSTRYNDAMDRYPMSGMNAWYSQRVIYTINRLLEDPEAPDFALNSERWVYEGTIVPINPFLAYFQHQYEHLVEYMERYKSGELSDLLAEIQERKPESGDEPDNRSKLETFLLRRLRDSVGLHRKILDDFPKPQAHFDFLTQSISSMKRELETWEEIVSRADGTLKSKQLPFQRLTRFLDQAEIPGSLTRGKTISENEELYEEGLQREFLRTGAYPYVFGLSTSREVDVESKLILSDPEEGAKWTFPFLFVTPEEPSYRGMIMVAMEDGEFRPFYPRPLMQMVCDRLYQLAGEEGPAGGEEASWFSEVHMRLDQALRNPRTSLLLDC